MKKKPIFSILLLIAHASFLSANPSFTIGSNPYLTIFGFPHKLLEWEVPATTIGLYYFPAPWQGNINDPAARPSDSYTTNYQSVDFAAPEDYTGTGDMSSYGLFGGYYDLYQLTGGRVFRLWDFVASLSLGGEYHRMSLQASGRARGYSEDAGGNRTYSVAVFDAKTENSRLAVLAAGILAGTFAELPFGLKLEAKYFFPNTVNGYFNWTKDGVSHDSGRLTWGWATVGCGNVFGFEHREDIIDTFYLDTFDVTSGLQADLQGSLRHGMFESAIRTRISRFLGDRYDWNAAQVKYVTDPNTQVSNEKNMIRAYSKMSFIREDPVNAGLLAFVEYDNNREAIIPRNAGSGFEPSSWFGKQGVFLECNPFLNLKIGKYGYLDIGVLAELGYEPSEYKVMRWSGVAGGNVETYANSTPYEGWTQYWESYSNDHLFFFATGFEASHGLPVMREISLLTSVLSQFKLTWDRKSYGDGGVSGASATYAEHYYRWNFKRELWMTGSFGVMYRPGDSWNCTVLIQFPLAYLLYATTDLRDTGGTSLFNHEKSNLFQVQESFKIRANVSFKL